MISKDRMDELEYLFWAETSDPETEEWRYDLTEEEAEIISEWDARVNAGFTSMISRMTDLQKISPAPWAALASKSRSPF